MSEKVRIGVLKLGNIGTAPMVEFLLDERAERQNINVRVITNGASLDPESAVVAAKQLLEFKPQLILSVGPNMQGKGQTNARKLLKDTGTPLIVITDVMRDKVKEELEAEKVGYIVLPSDPMIGARREFLDPTEMAVFNADDIKVLAITGVFNYLTKILDKVIDQIQSDQKPELPQVKVSKAKAINAANFNNPYAKAKAQAAFDIATQVAKVTVKACFMEKVWEKYTVQCAAAHELMRVAAKLADEARELEKGIDKVYRAPHFDDGKLLQKYALISKPE